MDNVLGSNDALSTVVTGLGVATIAAGVVVVVCAVFVVAERVRNHRTATLEPASAGQVAPAVAPTGTATVHSPMAPVSTPSTEGARPALPVGAEAALQAIVELGGDPRNVVVTHRDPTGEIRLHPLPTGKPAPDPAARPDLARSA